MSNNEISFEEQVRDLMNSFKTIKFSYIVSAGIILSSLDFSGRLLYIVFNILFPCKKTYFSIVKGENYMLWSYYWMIVLSVKIIEIWLESILMFLTFNYYFYFKSGFFYLIYKNIWVTEKIFLYFQEMLFQHRELVYYMQDGVVSFMSKLKMIKTLNKLNFKQNM